jgi:hypothetical protein
MNQQWSKAYHICRPCREARGLNEGHLLPKEQPVALIEDVIRKLVTEEVEDQVAAMSLRS